MTRIKVALGRVGALALALVCSVAVAGGPAYAVVGSNTVQVVNSPDDTVSGAPWARDTFSRKTTFQNTATGATVTIVDNGTFKTPAGVVGTLNGGGTWAIDGAKTKAPDTVSTYDRTGVALKDSFTGEWWKRFVEPRPESTMTVTSFVWSWTYKSVCWDKTKEETRTETPTGEVGARPSIVCPNHPDPHQSSSSTPNPHQSSSGTPKPHQSSSGTPKPHQSSSSAPVVPVGNNSGGGDALPVTGSPVGLVAGAAVLLLMIGSALMFVVRRRRATTFTV